MALPEDVENQLRNAIKKIGDVLRETNSALVHLGYPQFRTVAGSLSYNNADDGDVLFWNVVLSDGELVPQEVPVTSVVGIHTPDGNVEYRNLISTELIICPVRKWRCCFPGFRCVPVGGNIFMCCPDPDCK